ncbi:hypothetical protein SAMN02745108_01036 [Fibrobacter intestinalis]|uniref:Uncharacterized protein n=1 Tax=Fibrobacter intestinalis TaxID=28122 RepID=A0A1T4LVB6_9BACT|nr:hypothetical protein BGW94_2942 [Fibrobacter sp. NR9]SJZ58576.1 hypothetical protein SAMN02745108_01036 [Fibrobacter intestinalis]
MGRFIRKHYSMTTALEKDCFTTFAMTWGCRLQCCFRHPGKRGGHYRHCEPFRVKQSSCASRLPRFARNDVGLPLAMTRINCHNNVPLSAQTLRRERFSRLAICRRGSPRPARWGDTHGREQSSFLLVAPAFRRQRFPFAR